MYTDHTKDIAKCAIDIKKIQTSLIKRAKTKGIWENFGQKEERKLNDTWFFLVYDCIEIRNMLWAFNNWCMNYTGV